jgi:hypothetical protein
MSNVHSFFANLFEEWAESRAASGLYDIPVPERRDDPGRDVEADELRSWIARTSPEDLYEAVGVGMRALDALYLHGRIGVAEAAGRMIGAARDVAVDLSPGVHLPDEERSPLVLNESGEAIPNGEPIAHVQYARPEAVARVLMAPVGTGDGRSAFFWIRLHNGDLMLGTFPQGETYELLEGEPGTGWGDPDPLAPETSAEPEPERFHVTLAIEADDLHDAERQAEGIADAAGAPIVSVREAETF